MNLVVSIILMTPVVFLVFFAFGVMAVGYFVGVCLCAAMQCLSALVDWIIAPRKRA